MSDHKGNRQDVIFTWFLAILGTSLIPFHSEGLSTENYNELLVTAISTLGLSLWLLYSNNKKLKKMEQEITVRRNIMNYYERLCKPEAKEIEEHLKKNLTGEDFNYWKGYK
jgi:hypothetical protein